MSVSEQARSGMVLLKSELLERAGGTAHAFSARIGGVSEGAYFSLNLGYRRGDDPARVRENFRRFCAAAGARFENLVCSAQVHGDTVRIVRAEDIGWDYETPPPKAADAMITDAKGVVLAVFSADCIPILLYDPVRGVVGAVHAGWRGTALGIAEKTVLAMRETFGCNPADLLAAVGPGISRCCFETGDDVPAAMVSALGDEADPFLIREGGKWRVDLKGLNACFLRRTGIPAERVEASELCTACRPDLFWSHRRLGEERGSQAAVIALTTGT